MKQSDSDAEFLVFLQRLQKGDETAWSELLERWRRPVLNFVFRMTGDFFLAEEIAQETFVRISRKIGEFKPNAAAFPSWVFQIARNAALDALRHKRRHPADALEELPLAGGLIEDSVASPARDMELRNIGSEIAAAVQELPEEQRTALILAEYHDLTIAEIAASMGSSAKSVEARLYRARQTLRQKLAHLLDD